MGALHLGEWLKSFNDAARRDRIWQLGLLTGLRADKDGGFRPANFERGLILDRLVELLRPVHVLEIGTGRGLGAFALASAGREYGVEIEITTVDVLSLSQPQDYAFELKGERRRVQASCTEIWRAYLDPDLLKRITPYTGSTTTILPQLLRQHRTFDLIFIDAGHDLFSVVHDLAYSIKLLRASGGILLDDFAPLEEFGLGTCIAFSQAKRFFTDVELFPTEGLVFGGAVFPEAPRGMIFLTGVHSREHWLSRTRLPFWRLAGLILERCHDRRLFPIQ
jgi:predicted O-methyltransferase YrrM